MAKIKVTVTFEVDSTESSKDNMKSITTRFVSNMVSKLHRKLNPTFRIVSETRHITNVKIETE